MTSAPDGQKSRSLATQQALMDAAEQLIAEQGLQAVSIKQIVKSAGQKNESALQYHFGSMQGLIDAIHARRVTEIQEKRAEMLAELLSQATEPDLYDLCRMIVMPNFLIAKSSPVHRRYIATFSHEIAVTSESALVTVASMGGGGDSGRRLGQLLRSALSHLDESSYRMRMEIAVRTCSALLGYHARQKNAFRGKSATHFASNLVDAIQGMLSAPVSAATQNLER